MQPIKNTLRLFRSPLSSRIIAGMFLSLVAIEAILLVPSVQRRRGELLSQIEEVSTGKVRWIVTTYPAATGAELAQHLQQLQQDPMMRDILGGAVYDADGNLVQAFGEPPELAIAEALQNRQQLFTQTGERRYDIAWTTTGIGEGMLPDLVDNHWIVLRHNADGTQRALVFYILRISGLVLLIAGFITLAMMVLLSRLLITPILTLRHDLALAGETVACDDNAPEFASLRYPRKDELGEVIATFNQMYGQICGAISDRKQAEATLRHQNQEMQEYIRQVDQVTAAATAVDKGSFDPASLDDVAQRDDQLGQLARMFQLMAAHVQQRETKLKQQLMELTIEIDQAKLQKQVAQITESDYFQQIQAELKDLHPDEFWR
ncbi:methyl-accepting chemotaxis protein [Nodosilinea sp. LEGE 07088]|uniref:sensor histidine kinase n=1 Tax=Nodosilinea sp. LEGE 07088 TaxID=2777968 RepID=UPI00188292D8|nr:methyl-accepting chemotaxis protein [Nodosilinea sp. LEGE 07088]MBE9141015.1 methyl-accepting chemotaxis protein [Nodosilinea sp. LEGE 07088]